MKLPPTEDMVRALADAGTPRANDTIRSWRCGRSPAPAWAIVAIAKATGRDVGELAKVFARKWREKEEAKRG